MKARNRRISLGLRIALSAVLLSVLALAGFAAVAWWMIREAQWHAMDNVLAAQLQREILRPRSEEDWQQYQSVLAGALGGAEAQEVLLAVEDKRQGYVFLSTNWPDSVTLDTLMRALLPPPKEVDVDPGEGGMPVPPLLDAPPPPPFPHDRAGEGNAPFRPLARAMAARISPVQFSDITANGQHYRIAAIVRPGMHMVAGFNVDIVQQQMQPIRRAFVIAIALASLFVAAGAWWLSHRALQPLRRLTVAVRELGATQLDQRVDAEGDREIAELADSFNQMLERLERSFTQAARFSGDAAHELKTPLAILQAQVERALGDAEDGSPAQACFAGMLDEIQHLATVVRKLLLLSLADAGRLRLNTVVIDLTAELHELLEDARMLAPGLTINATIAEGLVVEADRDLLQQVMHNLLGNAIKYNIDNGWITMAAGYKDRDVFVSVLNASNGLTTESRKRLFERFYRSDASHAARADSAGLGLSLSREIARAHGGDLVLENSDPGIAQFSLRLPRHHR